MEVVTDLIAQRDALDKQIAETRKTARKEAMKRIFELMQLHGIEEVILDNGIDKRSKVAPKWKDPASDTTWTGRGIKPKFVQAALDAGFSMEDMRIK